MRIFLLIAMTLGVWFAMPKADARQYHPEYDLADVLDAIALVESGNEDFVIGDGGNAFGAYQIHESVVAEINGFYGFTYEHADMFDGRKARIVAAKYLLFWGRAYYERTGHKPTPEVWARIFNGGPRGYQKASTLKYWRKVERVLATGN